MRRLTPNKGWFHGTTSRSGKIEMGLAGILKSFPTEEPPTKRFLRGRATVALRSRDPRGDWAPDWLRSCESLTQLCGTLILKLTVLPEVVPKVLSLKKSSSSLESSSLVIQEGSEQSTLSEQYPHRRPGCQTLVVACLPVPLQAPNGRSTQCYTIPPWSSTDGRKCGGPGAGLLP